MRSFAVVIISMPSAENSIEREVLGRFEPLAAQVGDRQQQRERGGDRRRRRRGTRRTGRPAPCPPMVVIGPSSRTRFHCRNSSPPADEHADDGERRGTTGVTARSRGAAARAAGRSSDARRRRARDRRDARASRRCGVGDGLGRADHLAALLASAPSLGGRLAVRPRPRDSTIVGGFGLAVVGLALEVGDRALRPTARSGRAPASGRCRGTGSAPSSGTTTTPRGRSRRGSWRSRPAGSPVNARWNAQSMYTAARITPNVATIAYGRSHDERAERATGTRR